MEYSQHARSDEEGKDLKVSSFLTVIYGTMLKSRSCREGGTGTPWSELWNDQMKRCEGFDGGDLEDASESSWLGAGRRTRAFRGSSQDRQSLADDSFTLPCLPSTVVYGHAASRDLDIKRWTVGLDTGCLYGRRLTALVLQHPTQAASGDETEEEEDDIDEDEDEYEGDGNSRSYLVGIPSRIWGSRTSPMDRRTKQEIKAWTQRVHFGDNDPRIDAHIVSVKCPKMGELIEESAIPQISS